MDAGRKQTKRQLKEMGRLADYERLLGTAKLFPEERQVVDLAYLEGFTLWQVSARLNMGYSTAKSRHKSALAKLQKSRFWAGYTGIGKGAAISSPFCQ